MDIQKITDIIENSQLTDEAKDLINGLLPEAEKPEVQEEIMRIVDYEIKMNDAVAEEGREILKKIEDGNKMIDAVDGVADEQVKELETEANEKFAKIDKEKAEVDEDIAKLVGGENEVPVQSAPQAETPVAPTAPVSQWSMSPVVETPEVSTPTTIVPEVPVSDVSTPATQPAPFPGNNVG